MTVWLVLAGGALAEESPKLYVIKPDSTQKEICSFEDEGSTVYFQHGSVFAHCDPEEEYMQEISVSFSLAPSMVEKGDLVYLSWDSSGPEGYGCQPTINGGNVGGWQNYQVGIGGTTTLTTSDASEGEYELGIECSLGNSNTGLIESKQQLEITSNNEPDPDPQNPPEIKKLESQVEQNAPNGKVKITWTAANADACTASGAWAGIKPLGTNRTETVSGLSSGNKTFTLTCSKQGFNNVVKSTTIHVPGDSGPVEGCESRPELSELNSSFTRETKRFRYDKDGVTYADVWGEWPGQIGRGHNVELRSGRYVALEFNSGTFTSGNKSIRMIYEATQGGGGSTNSFGNMLFTISTCPGDFNKHAIENDSRTSGACYRLGEGANAINISTHEKSGACKIQPNQTYYLNFVTLDYYDYPIPDSPEDFKWGCGFGGGDICGALMGPAGSW